MVANHRRQQLALLKLQAIDILLFHSLLGEVQRVTTL